MNDDTDLIDKLRRLAWSVPREASPEVRERLLAAFRSRQQRKLPAWVYVAASIAILALGLTLLRVHRSAPPPSAFVYSAPGFVALPYSQSGVPLEDAVIIRVQMRPSELSSMGVAVPAAASTAKFKADILVGQDGVARAVRLVE
jgi:hypothetical protein